ncbi:hypothetical protein KBT16_26685 [Nostoc sp. CCCryo 231-06]|nr:hypothetical protein [Nostoc sp. CCCryo 231-06]
MKIKQIYHLTKNGWIKGFFKNQAGEVIENTEVPNDRVKTVKFSHNEDGLMVGPVSESTCYTSDTELLSKLSEQYPITLIPFPEDE